MEKILICTNHFYPESFRCNDIAFELAQKGYDVTVLTAIPDYPKGKIYEGYGFFRRRIETFRGVKIMRSFIIPRGNGNRIRIALNYLSFSFSSIIWSLFLAFFKRFDKILVHETSPVMIGIPAIVVKKIQRIPLLFWVLDLWPESLQAGGGIDNERILRIFGRLSNWIYHNSDKILVGSKGFEQLINAKGNFADKIVYFPNWADLSLEEAEYTVVPSIPKGFQVMFAGNIGEAQDFEHIMEAALLLKENKDIHFIFVGDGRKRRWAESFCKEHHLHETVYWWGQHPINTMQSFFEKADVLLITLKDMTIFNHTVPSKLQAYMFASKPILAMMNGEVPWIIKEANCGVSVSAGDYKGLADAILTLSKMDKKKIQEMGQNGRLFQRAYFTLDKAMNHLCELLDDKL